MYNIYSYTVYILVNSDGIYVFLYTCLDAVDTSQPSLMSISNYMPRLSPKAREIGIALGRENYPNELQGYDNMLILERVIQGWITSGSRCVGDRDVTVTWDYFLSVLRSPAVDMGGIAEKIERGL